MPTLLVIDDEPNVRDAVRDRLDTSAVRVLAAETAARGIELVRRHRPDALILDVRLPDVSGLEAFDRIRQIDPRVPVIFVTAHASTDTAIGAMKRGAFEYLRKPVNDEELEDVAWRALELRRLREQPTALDGSPPDDPAEADGLVGGSAAMQRVYKDIGRVAPEDVSVLILGESGTGKELVARALYQHSRRHERPFVAINCAALPEPLLESELFGHERGAFTGAERQRIGKFEQADGGTVFLDEVGDMSLGTQPKILRLLQDGRFQRVGGNDTIQVDVRVIAATNQDLESRVSCGAFRQDLLYRLNGFTIRLPALRERIDDLPLLTEYFLKLANRSASKPSAALSPETLELLQRYHWPGTVRELQSAIRYAVVHAAGEIITPDCLPEACRAAGMSPVMGAASAPLLADVAALVRQLLETGDGDVYRRVLTEVDATVLREALGRVGGNQVQASRRLGISRTTLRSKLDAVRERTAGVGASSGL